METVWLGPMTHDCKFLANDYIFDDGNWIVTENFEVSVAGVIKKFTIKYNYKYNRV